MLLVDLLCHMMLDFFIVFLIATSPSFLLGWRKADAEFICWDVKLAYRLSDCEVSMHELESAACFNQEYEFDDNDKFKKNEEFKPISAFKLRVSLSMLRFWRLTLIKNALDPLLQLHPSPATRPFKQNLKPLQTISSKCVNNGSSFWSCSAYAEQKCRGVNPKPCPLNPDPKPPNPRALTPNP